MDTHIDPRDSYGSLCRPENTRMMRALRLDIVYERAEGDRLFYRDEDGNMRSVTDFVGGYGATLFGHHHPAIVAAARDALDRELPFAAQVSIRARAAELAQRLHEILLERLGVDFAILFANTGTEAVEMALKHSEMRFRAKIETLREKFERAVRTMANGLRDGRFRLDAASVLELPADASADAVAERLRAIFAETFDVAPVLIALERGFHGKTLGSLSMTHYAQYREPFARMLTPVWFVAPDDPSALERVVAGHRVSVPWPKIDREGIVRFETHEEHTIVAMFAEPLQGEGGVRPLSEKMLRTARALADRCGFALILDEIQCGMGRTGTFLYSEQLGVVADGYLLSKSLGGGLAKISAFALRRDQLEPRFGLVHSSTFAEDDPSCAVALASLSTLLESHTRPMERASRIGASLRKGLERVRERHPGIVRDVRGAGLMLGVELGSAFPPGAICTLAEQDLLGYAIAGHLLHEHGLRVMPCISAPRVLRLEPSAFVSEVSIGHFIRAFDQTCRILAAGDAHALLRFLVRGERQGELTIVPAPIATTNAERSERRVGFIGYFIDPEQMTKWDASFAAFSLDERKQLIRRVHREIDPTHVGSIVIHSALGSSVELRYYGLFVDSETFYAHMRGEGREVLRSQVERAARMAKEDGCSVVGFGGLTSVITANCRDLDVEGTALTTGNSLTVAMCLDAARNEARSMGIDLANATVAALGAAGNIGSVYCLAIADEAERLILVGRAGREAMMTPIVHRIYERAYARLLAAIGNDGELTDDAPLRAGLSRALHRHPGVRGLLAQRAHGSGAMLSALFADHGTPPIVVTSDLDMLREADVILGASNAPHALIEPQHLGSGAVLIVDVAVPGDAHPSIASLAPRVRVISGGAVDLGPLNRALVPHGPLPAGHLYACATETAVLGLEGRTQSFSVGSIVLSQVEEIRSLAHHHGFAVAHGEHASALAPLKASA